MDNQNINLASEILGELKQSAKRWFLAFCIMVVLEVITIAGFIWYINRLNINNVNIENTRGYANYVGNDLLGDLYNGNDTSEENSQDTEEKKR